MTRMIYCDGADDTFVYFRTPSWTRWTTGLEYDIIVDRATGIMTCECKASQFFPDMRRGHVFSNQIGCKHMKGVLKVYGKVLIHFLTPEIREGLKRA